MLHVPRPRRSSPIALNALCLLLVVGCAAAPGWAQSQSRPAYARPPVEDDLTTRARRAANEQVFLSAERIIEILRKETGLLLEVKKALVEKAYEQGRILDPEDLTDSELFALLRRDVNARVLATREIERRYYVRAKPTREELQRQQQQVQAPPATEQARAGVPSQEEKYWSQREGTAGPEPVSPAPGRRLGPRDETAPRPREVYPPRDTRRELQRAEVEGGDYGPGSTTSRMVRIRPDQLPDVLAGSGVSPTDAALREEYSRSGVRSTVPNTLPEGYGAAEPDSRLEPLRRGQWPETATESRLRDRVYMYPVPVSPPPPREPNYSAPAIKRRPNPYADIPSLYDLYAQVSTPKTSLDRFGVDVFTNGTGNFSDLPMDLPVGPDYVLGPGDSLNIEMWGGVSERLQRTVDREGRIALPESGTLLVAGKNLGDVQHEVQAVLRTQFRDVQADVSLSRLRTVRIYVVGDVARPGAYDISSLSTPLNALYAAGGPTTRGSLRRVQHIRGSQVIQDVDLYELLLHGVRGDLKGLQPGDTIRVQPLGPEVTMEGMVRRPAVYELNKEKNLAEVLELSGGVLASGTLRHVEVERVEAHEKRTMLSLDIPETNDQAAANAALQDFKIQDGDKIRISPILPYSQKTVYLDGHVFHPGKYAYRDGMKLTDLVRGYSDLLPEPSRRHAEIIRLNSPDFRPEVLAFNLDDALSGKGEVPVLKPFDTVRIFGRYDFEEQPIVTVSGQVREPGDLLTNGATRLRDAIYLAGGLTQDALLDDAQIFRKDHGTVKVISVNLGKALSGDPGNDILLEPMDRVFVHENLARMDPPTVKVEGEVARPGKYPLGEGMTAADLVKLAGGLKRSAYTENADLVRYSIENGQKLQSEHQPIALAKALAGEADADFRLRDGDVLTIRQLPGWKDIGAVITVQGEVVHPGPYGIKDGERLSSILARAGGLRPGAYTYGAILERAQVREMEEKTQADLIARLEAQQTNLLRTPDGDAEQKEAKAGMIAQTAATLEKLRSTPPAGRVVIRIPADLKHWANTPADIEVRAGDVLIIPKRPNFVMVMGAVYNATAIGYRPGKSARWYLNQAGGPTKMANGGAAFVIRADGSVMGVGGSGWWKGSVFSADLHPGDMVVVPEKTVGGPPVWKNIFNTAQLASSVAVAVSVAKNF